MSSESDELYHQLLSDRAKRLNDENVELRAEVQRLQRALHFWLPGVPANDPEIAERASSDAFLLVGFDPRHPVELDAEARGLGHVTISTTAR